MTRDRAWRRHNEEIHSIRRLRRLIKRRWYWRGFTDINSINHLNPTIISYLSTKDHFNSKTLSTTIYDSRHKHKYSPNKCKSYYRDHKKTQTREYNNLIFRKLIKDYDSE